MKRVFLFLGAILLTSVMFLTSCDTTETEDYPPTISFVAGSDYISANATVTVGAAFTVKILAESNATSGKNLESLKVTRVFNLQSNDTTYTIPSGQTTFSPEISFEAMSEVGVEGITFEVTDKDGESASISLQITTENGSGGAINTWEMRILGSWNNLDNGSSFASINGNVYMLDQAFAKQALIDFIYWWGQSTSATIGAPNDANAALVFNTGDYALSNWTTLNATQFKETTLTSADFDAVADATPCIDNSTGANQTRIGELAVDDVIAFISVGGKHGLIRVKSITEGSAGSITIDVKVEI